MTKLEKLDQSQCQLWNQLLGISKLEITACSGHQGIGWNGKGRGVVSLQKTDESILLFKETGIWTTTENSTLKFSNCYRWIKKTDIITLEHLRYGNNNPVRLFDLEHVSENQWRSTTPHHCKSDRYHAEIHVYEHYLHAQWDIVGPKKNEHLDYIYR